VLVDWNRTEFIWPRDQCIHQLFEQQVQRTPGATAVTLSGTCLTYRNLNERANQLARFLRQRGVKPNSLVGLSLEPSLEAVIGVYGILKAGGAYVPLDPSYPPERLRYMLEAVRVRVLLTQEKFISIWGHTDGVEVIKLDSDWPAISLHGGDNPAPLATPQDLIYVIFTSGSTGKPKGAAIYHRGFTNLLNWFVTEFGITDADRSLLMSSLSFDLTQKNLFATLIRGGSLHLNPPGPYDVALLSRLIPELGITLINCTPSAFYPLVELSGQTGFDSLSSLRIVFLGGEPISMPRLRPWLKHPSCRTDLANTYGPTECTDICAAFRLSRKDVDRYESLPLGRPIHNVQLAIVDSDLQPCPVGAPGELCIAGEGLGAGYLNDPEMTAAKFKANPFPEILGHTIYRTGDQARWLPEGVIEFLGRLDHQVKIRGFRVELHEIEALLSGHPSVREAVVVVRHRPGGGGDTRLACFFVTKNLETLEPCVLRQFLKSHLPEYMVPSSFQQLPRLPLSPNGKVDRRALACAPETASLGVAKGEAVEGMEAEIRKIWLEVLQASESGRDDNFFDLGGNSIHLAQVHARLQRFLGKVFPITDLFEHTTLRALASHFSHGVEKPRGTLALKDRARRQQQAFAACNRFRGGSSKPGPLTNGA